MFSQKLPIIVVVITLMVLLIGVQISAAQSHSFTANVPLDKLDINQLGNVFNSANSITPYYYGEYHWHHRYHQYGHHHYGLSERELRHNHRNCVWFDGAWHYPRYD